MPVPRDLQKFVIKGTLPGGESMQHSIYTQSVVPGVGPDQGDITLQDMANQVRDEWIKFLKDPTPSNATYSVYLATATRYDEVVGYSYDNAGVIVAGASAAFTTNNVGTTSAGTATLPTDTALVASFLTGVPGASNRGRIYLGGFSSQGLSTNGRAAPTMAQHIATALARFLNGVGAIQGAPDLYNPVVASFTTGQARKIKTVSVGDVFDRQRSRRASLVEARQSASVD